VGVGEGVGGTVSSVPGRAVTVTEIVTFTFGLRTDVPVMLAAPAATPTTTPEVDTVATEGSDEAQVTPL
jgi:hypothetical protein